MADITINKVINKNYYIIRFKSYSDKVGFQYKLFWSDDIATIGIDKIHGYVVVELKYNTPDWKFSFDGSIGTMKIDTVGGTTPDDNDHLATLLADLKN